MGISRRDDATTGKLIDGKLPASGEATSLFIDWIGWRRRRVRLHPSE
jgi:hypothetical protein